MAQEDDWQPGPSWPFRVGLATPGFGIGIGCGAGIGFPSAKLGAIPIIGPAVLSGLALLPGPVAGFAAEARRQLLQALGVKWLDAGMGCGVGLGYGYGGGIVLKPSAAEELATTLQSLAGRGTAFVQHGLQQSGVKPEAGSAAPSTPSMLQQLGTSGPVHVTMGLPQGAMPSSVPDQMAAPTSNVPGKDAGLSQGMSAGAGEGGSAAATSLPGLGLSISGLGNASFDLSPGPSGAGMLPGSQVLVKGQGGVGALPSLLAAQQVLSLLITQQQQLEGLGAAAGVMQAQLGEMADRLSKQERETAELRAALLAVSDALQQGSDEGAGDVAAKQPAGRGGGKGRGKQRSGS